MSLDISPRWEPQIEQIAQAQHITTDEAIDRIVQAGVERLRPDADATTHRTYASFFGAVEGPGAHGSPEAVDRYIEELRKEW